MQIKLTPQRSDVSLTFAAIGDLLVVNGIGFDLAQLAEGDRLSGSALIGAPATGNIERIGGDIVVRLIEPNGRGEVTEPRTVEAPSAAGVEWAAGTVDWSQLQGPPDQEEVIADYDAALEAHFDAVAAQRNYNSRNTAALRAGYPGPFQAEGLAFAQWMDACNVQALQTLADVRAELRPAPTIEEFIAELPAIVWPASPFYPE